ncbi:sulfatase [Leadbetterella byssophila DSM 17132]|uniref:Sulfatase n=1 Tax=Leadbetterella byssophila (strain DSM 17132 / JCM 16389 / KACC 11308 / NBRC 106382 / 4M15) TaxID=649349 RepID=E4RXD5_LEAB4|nr:sulfatase-like hydrolase/transferase [Leadbetterella byssophila]ADQ16280.1 sulfatase [Leadbetterella byssophila DSM 17132]
MLAQTIYEVSIWVFLIYSILIFIIYGWIGYYAFGALKLYKQRNLFTDYNLVASNPNAPRFSIVAPAYNEGKTIVENVRSLLSLFYNNLEIIIVNDGSKDDSIDRLIAAYDLEATSFFVQGHLPTQDIKAVYRSKNLAFKKLVVVDKVNGGKADALNAGINVSSGDYLVCIDVDCILEQDAILKLAKPFLEQTDKKVIACGGVIRLANNCIVENGKVVDVNLPKTWLGKSQALEYIRAFVLGRMAWSRASALILISGAFGAFDRKIVLECGGYDPETVGEDMELVVRMRRYMEEKNEPYKVVNIPDPLCWTEVPEKEEVLKRQRNRWMRGTMETLWKHRKLIFNPKYGKLGMMSMPYWLFFEFLGPIVESLGYVFFAMLWIFGLINWQFFLALYGLVICTGITYSVYGILVDLASHQVYTKRKDFWKLIATANLEPLYFHPLVVRASVSGVLDYFRNKQGWGEMTRQGFRKGEEDLPLWKWVLNSLERSFMAWFWPSMAFIGITCILAGVEAFWYRYQEIEFDGISLFRNNLEIAFQCVMFGAVFYLLLRLLNVRRGQIFLVIYYTFLSVLYFVLFLYFSEGKSLLGADAFIYSKEEVWQIVKSSGVMNPLNIGILVFMISAVACLIYVSLFQKTRSWIPGFVLFLVGFMLWGVNFESEHESEMTRMSSSSKWAFFFEANYKHLKDKWWPENELANAEFPFLHQKNTTNFLKEYLNSSAEKPNIVLIIVEGLGSAYTRSEGYIGNFTPFFDSLTTQSLYWKNALSSSGRTFAALPTLTGSLPFAQSGFLELNEYPSHFSLWNILKKNGYQTGFFYGGHASFDRMKDFLVFNEVDQIIERNNFPDGYRLLPNNNGETWGYEDASVLSVLSQAESSKPYFHVALTLSTHNPFIINDKSVYEEKFEQRVKELKYEGAKLKQVRDQKKALTTVLELDDNLRHFMQVYSQRDDFHRTIFIITGDHAMPEIPFETKLDRYRVPLLIYSPLIKTPRTFKQMVSHFDLVPSLLSYLENANNLIVPQQVTWIGEGLQGSKAYPLMQSKTLLQEYITPKYHWVGGETYVISADLQEERVPEDRDGLGEKFKLFKQRNQTLIQGKPLMPDSVYTNFLRRFD